jgi:saccharopine dehydrogenase (NAD+, L-lysine forming)
VSAKGRYFENGKWVETDPLSIKKSYHFPNGIGEKNIYLMYHEELESLTKFFPEIKRARFWMTFSDSYLKHLEVLENVGMTSIEPIDCDGVKIIPLQFLKKLLPDPASLASRTKGKTCIGVTAKGIHEGKTKEITVYNICDHEEAFKEVNSQAISYTTGVPTMIGAMMVLTGKWKRAGVFNMEQFDPEPFMQQLMIRGLPWQETIS